MPTAFFRTKLKPGVTREQYRDWVSKFVYDNVPHMPSVIEHHIFPMDGTVLGEDPPPYDNIEAVTSQSLSAYYHDLQNNPSAAAIAREMQNYVEVLDQVYGDPIPPGLERKSATESSGAHQQLSEASMHSKDAEARKSDKERTQEMMLKCRTGQHVLKMTFVPVPSTPPGHTMGAGQSAGLAFFEDGQVANLSMGFTVDFIDGKSGTHVLYTKFAFEDGSFFTILEPGSTTASADGQSALFESSAISFVDGQGRFFGIEGHGTMSGKRFAPLGAEADTTLDYSFTFTLPQK